MQSQMTQSHFSEQIVQKDMETPFLLTILRNMDPEVMASLVNVILKHQIQASGLYMGCGKAGSPLLYFP